MEKQVHIIEYAKNGRYQEPLVFEDLEVAEEMLDELSLDEENEVWMDTITFEVEEVE